MMTKILVWLLAAMMLTAACGAAATEVAARSIETAADAEEWITVFLGEEPEKLEGAWVLSAEMETAVAMAGGLGGLANQLKAALGTAGEIGAAYEGKVQGYQAFYVPCAFSVMPADLVLIIHEGEIIGLSTATYSGGREKETESDVYDSIELALPVPGLGELPGILTVPKGDGPFPAVVLLSGSGPNDKDETVGSLKPFRDIAESLAEQEIAVYRFDKRSYTYGEILAAEKGFTPEDEYVEDAVNAVQLAAQQDKVDPDRIFVLGHSQGGNMIPAVARALEQALVKACGFIMMAASPRPLDVLIREQYDFLYSLMPEITEEQQLERDLVFADLDRLEDLDSMTEDDTVILIYSAYWKWLAAYDILQAAEEITEPVLLLQGEEDYQVTLTDFNIWKDALGEKENWQMITYPGLTHLFMPGLKTEGSAAYEREGRIDTQVLADIGGFVNRTMAEE